MGDKNIIKFINTGVFSYQDLSAKLYSYCAREFGQTPDIKIVFLHSEHDIGIGAAVLKLFKQFATFPVDIPVSKDCHELFEISDIAEYSGTTLVISALPLYPVIVDSTEANQKIKYFPQTLSAMQKLQMSAHRSSVEQQAEKAIQALSKKTAAFRELLSRNNCENSGNLIFL